MASVRIVSTVIRSTWIGRCAGAGSGDFEHPAHRTAAAAMIPDGHPIHRVVKRLDKEECGHIVFLK
jgi:hypothetical protein